MQRSVGVCLATCAVAFTACGKIVSGAPGSDASPGGDASPPPVPFLSCAGLPATCGANGNDDCCRSLALPAGSYDRSYDLGGTMNSGTTSFPASVSDFRLDKYKVTVGRFRAFVAAGMGTQASPPPSGAGAHAKLAGSGWDASWNTSLVTDTAALRAAISCDSTYQTWTDTPAANEHRPINCIDWYEAMAFCIWDGGYLPTEAEWNYAAAGGDEQRVYPWSNPSNSTTIDGSYASYGCMGDGTANCTANDLVAVGIRPAGDSRWGQSDMAGNAWEFTLDWNAAYVNPCMDCANLVASDRRVSRGGSFQSAATTLQTGVRGWDPLPPDRLGIFGIRCARAL
jgi:formylglycine-generating enzyme